MRRLIAQWMISRSIDCGRDVPAWVRSWLGDEETIRFEASARRLADALKHDAPAWRTLTPNVDGASRLAKRDNRGSIGWRGFAPRWVAAGIIVCGLLAGGIAFWSRPSAIAEQRQQIAAVQPANEAALVRDDVDWLIAAFDESQTSFGQLVTRLDTMMTPRAHGKSIETQVDAAVTFFAYRLPASTAKVAGLEHASATLGSPNSLSRFWLGNRGT